VRLWTTATGHVRPRPEAFIPRAALTQAMAAGGDRTDAEDSSSTRRALATVAVVALLLTGAAWGAISLADTGTDSPADRVPAGVDYVGHADTDALRADPALAEASLASLRFQSRVSFYAGPAFERSFAFDEGAALDPAAASSVTYFGRSNGSAYRARLVETDWRPADVAAAVEARHGAALSRGEYRGAPLYAGDGLAVAALDERRVAVGTPTAVRDAVDVARGERAAVSGPLGEAFAREAGYVRFAYRFEPATVPRYVPFVSDAVRDVERVSGSYALERSRLAVRTNVTTEDAAAARAVEGILRAGVTFYRVESGNETMRRELDAVRIARHGRAVRVSHAAAPADYPAFVRGLDRNQPRPNATSARRLIPPDGRAPAKPSRLTTDARPALSGGP